jgi:hypothetical protein
LASRRKTSFAIISNCPATIARRSQSVDPTKADSQPIPAFCITNSRFLLERVPINWIHLIDKDSHKIKELEHVLIKKAEQLFRDMPETMIASR